MASANDSAAPARLLRWFHRFDQDERGTALTELIVTLPVFIIIFVGMVNLYKIERESVRVKILANQDLWNNAMAAAEGQLVPPPKRGIPVMAGVDAMSTINDYPSAGARGRSDYADQWKNLGLISNASVGEGDNATQVLDIVGEGPSGSVPGKNLSKYPQDMLDDSRINFISSAPGALSVYSPIIPLSMVGPNQAIAANTRYGMVAGTNEHSFSAAHRTYNFEAAYEVLNSPVAKPRMHDVLIVPGFSRLMAEADPCLSNVLELSRDMGYMSNCF